MREKTCVLIEKAEGGSLTWEAIARGCLSFMSEEQVADMADSEGLLTDSECETVNCPRCGNEESSEELLETHGQTVCYSCFDDLNPDE